MHRFRKLLFRATRAKAFAKFYDMEVPTGDRLKTINGHRSRVVYICAFEEGLFFKDKIQKLCASFLEPL